MALEINSLPRIPSFIKDEVKYRGAATSHNYNQGQEEIAFDLVNLYNVVNEYSDIIEAVGSNHIIENMYTQARIARMERDFFAVKAQLDAYQNNSTYARDRSKHLYILPEQFYTETDMNYPANIDRTYRHVTLPRYGQIYKLYLYDEVNNHISIPNTLKVSVEPPANDVTIIDNGFTSSITDNRHEWWVRRVIDNSNTAVECTVTIELPDTIISNRDINTIEFQPYPYHSMDVISMEYKLNGGWNFIPGIKSYYGTEKEIVYNPPNLISETYYIQEAGNIKVSFPRTPMGQIRIKFRQRSYVEEQDNRIFYMGLKHFNIKNEIVNTKYCEFSFDLEFDKVTEEPKIITSLIPVFDNADVLRDKSPEKRAIIQYEFYSMDDSGALEYISGTPLSVESTKYHVKAKMYYDEENGCNPTLRMIDVVYQTVADYDIEQGIN